eukprot:scaffold98715_cov32-Tisochrysis_lutea.AAC.2
MLCGSAREHGQAPMAMIGNLQHVMHMLHDCAIEPLLFIFDACHMLCTRIAARSRPYSNRHNAYVPRVAGKSKYHTLGNAHHRRRGCIPGI